MNLPYYCPECKKEMIVANNKYNCINCFGEYIRKENNEDFDNSNYISNENNELIKKLCLEIKNGGYQDAVNNFVINNKQFEIELCNTEIDKSIDIIFHTLGKNPIRCLVIRNNLGNKSEILSKIFKEVYVIEFDDDLIEFQKERFLQKKCENISIAKCNLLKLPYPNNYFDLILCNEVLQYAEKFSFLNNLDFQKQFILELKRVINDEGSIFFQVDNNFDIQNSFGKFVKKITQRNFSKFYSMIKNSDLIVKSYWALPSFDKPYYSGTLDDKVSLVTFFRNIDKFTANFLGGKRQKLSKEVIFKILKIANYSLLKKLLEVFSQSLIFCCTKKSIDNSLELWIKNQTGYDNIIRMSRHQKILFMLLNKNGEIEKAVFVKRVGKEIPDKIHFYERNFPNVKEPNDRVWMIDWIKGRTANPDNENEILKIIDWLIQFQKNNKIEKMSDNDINDEIIFIKNGLKSFKSINREQYNFWLEQYKNFLKNNKFNLTPVHGDFWFSNILIDNENDKINIIDWETYSERGNPLEDFIWFITNYMGMPLENFSITFKDNLDDKGKRSDTLRKIKNKINLYFGFDLDYLLLMRVYLMKWLVIQDLELRKFAGNKNLDNKTTKHIQMIEILSKY